MDLPDPGIELGSPVLQADSLLTELSGKPLHLSKLPITFLLLSKSFFEAFVLGIWYWFLHLTMLFSHRKEGNPAFCGSVDSPWGRYAEGDERDRERQILSVLTPTWLAQLVKNLPASAGRHKRYGFKPWVGKIPWSRKWQPTPLFLSEKFHGRRSLVGYNPWSHKESNTTERLSVRKCARTHTHTQIVERGCQRVGGNWWRFSKVTISSYIMNKFWGPHVQYGDYN